MTKDWSENPRKITRSALGKVAFIGELYDARTDIFCNRFLFTSSFPKDLIKTQQSSKCEIEYSYRDDISDRFNLLKIEAELQLAILFGLFKLQGSGKYLEEEKQSSRTVSCSLFYNVSTVCEKLMTAFSEIEQYIDKDALQDDQYTHVVVEVNWGANCTVSLQYHSRDSSKRKEIEGMLKGELSMIAKNVKVGVGANVSYANNDVEKSKNIDLKVYADVVPTGGIPSTVEKAVEFIESLPILLKEVNDGKGNPLNYVMIPLSDFKNLLHMDKAITTMIKAIDESFVIQVIAFFEELADLKQKLNDLEKDFEENEKYLPGDELSRVRSMNREIKMNETKLKTDLAEDLPNVRAGKIEMSDLIKKLENHKAENLNLLKIKEFIAEFTESQHKLDMITMCISKEVLYLGKDENLDYYMNNYTDYDFFVMYRSKELVEKDPGLWRESLNFFLSKSQDPKQNTLYIIVDFDIVTDLGKASEMEKVKIYHYKGCRVVSEDVYEKINSESDKNLAQLVHSTVITYVQYKPNNLVTLELQCPGFRLGTCPEDPLTWTCNICKRNLEYGFDDFFYCNCGKAECQLYEFKCNSITHGNKYLSVSENFPLNEELEKFKPLKEMNILILGQSGVGKSTWINSIVNYLKYETLEEAAEGGVVCVIPANFTVTYATSEKCEQQVVEVGNQNANEILSAGKSATQDPKTYNFVMADRDVRLIDTPGLGDTEGIERDKENMKKILDHISFLKEIHGICILLKSNERRIDVIFKFCIMELLSHLHKSAARNILFCFTNSRSSFYSPGDTYIVLNSLLRELKLDDMITLCLKTMFCLDNEAFRFLCRLQYPNIPPQPEDTKIYVVSWERSVATTKRLFDQIKELEPHSVADTTTLCNARTRILSLTKPIADITQTIQINIAAIKDQENRIKTSNLSLEELAKDLYIPHIALEAKPLNYPRTVCTNQKCVKVHKGDSASTVEYVQICHDHCTLSGITTDRYPQPGLKGCAAMTSNNNGRYCRQCGCTWDLHMHITYIQERKEKNMVNAHIENEINSKKSAIIKVEEHLRELKAQTEKYEAEQKIIMKISLKFGVFLKDNAIAPYNDGFQDYIKYLINQEERKVEKTKVDDQALRNLNEMLERYNAEKKILEDSMKSNEVVKNLTPRDIVELEKELYSLELTGKQLKNNADISARSNAKAQRYAEEPLPLHGCTNPLFGGSKKQKKRENNSKRSQKNPGSSKKKGSGITSFIKGFFATDSNSADEDSE